MRAWTVVVVALLLLIPTRPVHAQSLAGLRGQATDATGLSLPNVAVELRGEVVREAATNSEGRYRLDDVPAGTYRVTFRLPGFATTVKREVRVDTGQSVELDARLQLVLSANVLVTASRTFRNLADVEAGDADLLGVAASANEGVVSAAQIASRPAFRAGEVLETVPGVVISQHSGEGKANQYYVRGFNIDHGTDLANDGGGRAREPAHARARTGLLRSQLPHPRARGRRAVPQGPVFRRGG
jgi:hypothetical protein